MRVEQRPPCKRPGFRSHKPNPTVLSWSKGKWGGADNTAPGQRRRTNNAPGATRRRLL